MLLNCGVGEDSWESLGLQGDPTSPSWCWRWNSNTLVIWCEELTHWKRPCCWQRLKVGGEGDYRGWDGWMASPTQWTRVWINSRVGDGQGGLSCCSPWGLRVRHNWVTVLNENILYSTGDSIQCSVVNLKGKGNLKEGKSQWMNWTELNMVYSVQFNKQKWSVCVFFTKNLSIFRYNPP